MERKRERDRVGEKGGKKEAALGFASGRAHSSNIDSVLLFFFLLRPFPPHPALSLSVSLWILCISWRIEPIAPLALPILFCVQDHFSLPVFTDRSRWLFNHFIVGFFSAVSLLLFCSFWTSLNSFSIVHVAAPLLQLLLEYLLCLRAGITPLCTSHLLNSFLRPCLFIGQLLHLLFLLIFSFLVPSFLYIFIWKLYYFFHISSWYFAGLLSFFAISGGEFMMREQNGNYHVFLISYFNLFGSNICKVSLT